MKRNRRHSISCITGALVLIVTLLSASTADTYAGSEQDKKEYERGEPAPVRKGRTRSAFSSNNAKGWAWVRGQCGDKDNDWSNTVGCAQAAILEVSTECGESAKFFRKGAGAWQWISFGLMISSAALIGMGAETMAKNAKVWSTLGGATGLGALTTTLTSNMTGDLNAVNSINATLASFNTFVTSAGGNYGLIYETAPIYAKQCTAIANGGTATTPAAAPQPSKLQAPTNVVATAGNAQASVAFTAPANTGGSPITSYTVVATPGGATNSGPSSPIVVSGLTNGTSYTFTVTATNSSGTSPASMRSNQVSPAPATVPGPPTNVTPTAGNGQASVAFTAPASNGGANIASYAVTASPGGATATGTASPITVTGLTNGTNYTFTVTATNSAGPGAASAPSTQVTPTALTQPGAPTNVVAMAGHAQASVAFTAPAYIGGAAITSYTVTASPGGASATGPSSPITVTGLANGTAYTFTVTATNSVGTGPASAPSSPVTPAP